VVFGEVLFDTFPDGSSVLGGAPFNVAWHLKGFGLEPLFISRVGDDEPGRRAWDTMDAWGMTLDGVQKDTEHPTGKVQVSLDHGQPTFSILPDQAYDFVALEAAAGAVERSAPALLYHGSLCARHEESFNTLRRLRARCGVPVFVDVNLRSPWWSRELVSELLADTRWAKLNDDELNILTGLTASGLALETAADGLRRGAGLELLIVTRGTAGAFLVTEGEIVHGSPVVVEHVVDTVGAGDAFSAVMLVGLVRGWPFSVALRRAMVFAAAICERRGATVADRGLYRDHQARWETEH
jgi:fructokinase